MLFVPLDGLVEACLDYTPKSNSYALRIEGMDTRIIIMTEKEGAASFLAVFEQFLKDIELLKDGTLHD